MGRRLLLLLWREQEVDAAYTTWNIEATQAAGVVWLVWCGLDGQLQAVACGRG